MKVLIPFHIGSGNRGCEGIIRGTKNIIKVSTNDLLMLDKDQKEYHLDVELGLNEIGTLSVKSKRTIFSRMLKKIGINTKAYYLSTFKKFVDYREDEAICLFTGGDLFCYASTIKENCCLLQYLKRCNIKTFLWGASIEERFIDSNIEAKLKEFDGILCRETLSFETLKRHGINKNVFCFPDPAFTLEPAETSLPEYFTHKKIVGINISNMVNGNSFSMDTPFMKAVQRLFDYIITETDYDILLIPHVTWGNQDDRKICDVIQDIVHDKTRVNVLNIDKLGYLQIRYIISKCELFIGGRTHSVISAYSMEIPTLALGYSVKAIGIAKDLGLNKKLVFDSKKINDEDSLLQSFKYLMEHADEIRTHLHEVLPEYKKNVFKAKELILEYID